MDVKFVSVLSSLKEFPDAFQNREGQVEKKTFSHQENEKLNMKPSMIN